MNIYDIRHRAVCLKCTRFMGNRLVPHDSGKNVPACDVRYKAGKELQRKLMRRYCPFFLEHVLIGRADVDQGVV